MKHWIAGCLLVIGFGANAVTYECAGTGTVDNVGLIETAEIQLRLDLTKNVLAYKGPHASIFFPSGKEFTLPVTGTTGAREGQRTFYVANASSSTHGGETNTFYVEKLATESALAGKHERHFVYLGSYGYRVDATLACSVGAK